MHNQIRNCVETGNLLVNFLYKTANVQYKRNETRENVGRGSLLRFLNALKCEKKI